MKHQPIVTIIPEANYDNYITLDIIYWLIFSSCPIFFNLITVIVIGPPSSIYDEKKAINCTANRI